MTKCCMQRNRVILQINIHIFEASLSFGDRLNLHTPISKNVVGENGEWQLSNGNCTIERNCGFHIWYAKTMSSSRGAKLGSLSNQDDDGNKKTPQIYIFDNEKQYFCPLCTCIFIF